ncbi:MAG: protein tyrosine phosphatase family protein [Pseudomonadota bacterium]
MTHTNPLATLSRSRPSSLSILLALAIAVISLSSQVQAQTPASDRENPKLESVRNFHRVSDSLLTSGQIYPAQIPALKQEGVDFVVNLAIADPERNAEEPYAMMDAGLNYVNIPVSFEEPSMSDLDLFFAVMDARGERKTLVHCFANFRASAFTFLYRVLREGVPEEEARRDLLAVWDDETFDNNPAWVSFIDEALATQR